MFYIILSRFMYTIPNIPYKTYEKSTILVANNIQFRRVFLGA